MGAALKVEDRIGVGEDLVVIRVVVLHRHVDHGPGLGRILVGDGVAERDRFVVQDDLVRVEETHELGDAVLEQEPLVLLRPFVVQIDEDARVEERQFAQAVGEDFVLEFPCDLEDLGIRFEGDLRAGLSGLAFYRHLLDGFPLRETHVVDLAVPAHLRLEPFGDGVDAFRADPMQAAGHLVGALAELARRVKIGQDQLERRDLVDRMQVDRDAAPVVLDRA